MPEKKVKVRSQSSFDFKIMSLAFKVRNAIKPRARILKEVGIKSGDRVLDYGCGPGGYVMPVIKLIGNAGVLYALDIHPLAIESVQTLISKKGISNVQVILSGCDTGLTADSIDVVLLYDILHDLENRGPVLTELNRVIKPGGVLSVTDHHLKEAEIISGITGGGLFKLSAKGEKTYSFSK